MNAEGKASLLPKSDQDRCITCTDECIIPTNARFMSNITVVETLYKKSLFFLPLDLNLAVGPLTFDHQCPVAIQILIQFLTIHTSAAKKVNVIFVV